MPSKLPPEEHAFRALDRVEAHWRAALSHLLHDRAPEAAVEVERAHEAIAEVHRLDAAQGPLELLERRRRIDALQPLHLELLRLSERAQAEAAAALAHAAEGRRTLEAYAPPPIIGPGQLA